MRVFTVCAAVASLVAVSGACTPKNQQSDPSAYPQNGYPPPGQPGQPPQGQAQYPGYPPPQATPGYPAQPPPPGVQPGPVPAGSAPMSVPGPLAFTCQNDVPCGTHHCNMQYSKCAFPCQTANDCIQPNQCMAGLCVPLPPQPH